jgi:hypothetical protein
MKIVIGTYAQLVSLGLTRGLARAAAVASMIVTFGIVSIGPSGVGLLGISGLAIVAATPAQARCLVGGVMRTDIAEGDCEEAKRTGCVRSMLTPNQYISCLDANKRAYESGRKDCIINGKNHNELNDLDCAEAKQTGCVRRLLTGAQYTACLDAQPKR